MGYFILVMCWRGKVRTRDFEVNPSRKILGGMQLGIRGERVMKFHTSMVPRLETRTANEQGSLIGMGTNQEKGGSWFVRPHEP